MKSNILCIISNNSCDVIVVTLISNDKLEKSDNQLKEMKVII